MRWLIGLLLAFGGLTMPAGAQESTGDALRGYLYGGGIAPGLEAMSALGEADPEARFGVGVLTLFSGIEELAQALYRHGFNPERGVAVGPFFGMARPEAAGVEPEPLTYEALRDYLEQFSAAMDAARPLLLAASEGEFAVEIDVMQIRADINGDGTADATESVGAFLAVASRAGQRFDMGMGMVPEPELTEAVFAFDASDAIWLAAYSQVLAAQADFLLAHDFETFFDAALHRLFPGAGLAMETQASTGEIFMDRDSDALLADAIAMVHTIDWPVIDRDRLMAARDRALTMIELSRRNWQSILAETDDYLEFMPSPHQSPTYEGMEVTKDMVKAWHETLDASEAILKGDLLLPHWRYKGVGFDLAAWFEEAERTDAILLFTGLDALPFLKQGEVASAESFAAANAVFGRSLWIYALWFN